MTKLLNSAGTQYYANKMCNADNRKVGNKSLTTALADIDNLIDEMKTSFDAEYGSALDMKLENNENVFSVGTGTDVDKRSEVENSFTDVELYGNSLVNIAPNYEINWTHSGTWLSNFLMTSTYQNSNYFKAKVELKPNTTYSIIVNVTKNTSDIRTLLHNANAQTCYFQESMPISAGQTGVVVFVQKTISDFNALNVDDRVVLRSQSGGATTGETIIKDIIILEGDYTNKPLPQYFEGLKSVGQKEDGDHKISISSVGKNLFNINENPSKEINPNHSIKINDFNGYDIIAKNDNSGWIYSTLKHKIILKPNKDYRISCDIYKSNQNSKACIRLYSPSLLMSLGTLYSSGYVTFRTPSVVDDFYLLLYSSIDDIPCKSGDVFSYRNIQIEAVSDSNNDYSPFRIDKKEISLNEPLRSLPNGVKDTIENVNGEWKIIRRCVQIDLNGTEYWTHENPSQEDGVNTALFSTNDILNAKDFPKLCDRFIPKNSNLMLNSHPDSEGIGCWSAKKNVNIRINKNRLSTVDSDGFKEWLSQNPTKVIYELATPIIEDISPVTLQCWKNGTISIDEVLPVESTHEIALNKAAQIKNNMEELVSLKKKVQNLEKQYDQIALEQAHQLSLLKHSYEVDYDI